METDLGAGLLRIGGFLPDYLAVSASGVIVTGNRYGEGTLVDQAGSEESEMWVGLPRD